MWLKIYQNIGFDRKGSFFSSFKFESDHCIHFSDAWKPQNLNPRLLCWVELNSPLALRLRQTEKKPRSIDDGGNLSSRQRVSELRGSLLRQFVVKVYKTGAVHCVLPHCALDPPHCEQAWEKWEGQVTLVQILVILHTFFGQIVLKISTIYSNS